MHAALKGSAQIGFTIMSLTVSLIAVLIPLLFMSDVVGRLFREFAITLAVTILVSAVVSLTLTPMMCSRILKSKATAKETRFYYWSEKVFNSIIASYGQGLRTVLKHRFITLLVTISTFVAGGGGGGGGVLLFIAIPKGFFPVQDTGVILGISEAPQTVSLRHRSRASKSWSTSSFRIRRSTVSPRSSGSTAPIQRSTQAESKSPSSPLTSGKSPPLT